MGVRPAVGPVLVVLGGRPGVGKTTLARAVARRLGIAYLRLDAIEQAMRDAGLPTDGPVGYGVAQALALSNLVNGVAVVADSVNPVPESRAGWREVAFRAGARLLEVEVLCSDASEHRRRVETRTSDIPGLVPPTWAEVAGRAFAPWPEAHLVVDTARGPVEGCVTDILGMIERSAMAIHSIPDRPVPPVLP